MNCTEEHEAAIFAQKPQLGGGLKISWTCLP